MDISAIYSKTPKGLRARASLIGGLSSQLMKVLTHVDGTSKAENILLKFDKLTPQQLSADLTKLEQEGYIRLATVTSASDNNWALTINFEPMVVEEYQSEEELEVNAQAKKAEQTRQQEQKQAEQAQAIQLATEIKVKQQAKQEEEQRQVAQQVAQQKAEKKAQKLRAKEKTKAETKVKALLEQERIALESAKSAEVVRIKIEAEVKLIAQQETARVAEQQAAERAAKLTEELARKTALKAREVAEQAEIDAEEKAKQHAHREIERISREAEEAQKKADAETKAKQEAERLEQLRIAKAAEDMRQAELKAQAEYQAKLERAAKEAAEQARVEAEAVAEAAEKQQLEQAEKAAQEAVLKEKLAQEQKEKARQEIANVLRKAEGDRKNAVAQAKAEKLEAKRQAKAEQEAHLQAERKAKEETKELAKQQKLKTQAEEKAKAEAADNARRDEARITKESQIARKTALENKQFQANKAADALAVSAEVEKTDHLERKNQKRPAEEVIRANLLAEEQASTAAKQNVQHEMERIGREAEQVRQKSVQQQKTAEVQKALAQQYLLDKQDFDSTEAAEEAAFEADEEADEAADKIQRTIRKTASEKITKQVAEDSARADIRNAAIAAAEAMASVHSKAQSFLSAKKMMQWLTSVSKVTFIYAPVLVLILLLLVHFTNLSMLIKPIEQLASESIGEPVEIKKVHASLWPQPHLVLEGVAIGTGNSIQAVHVLPVATSLFEEIKVVKSLVIEGLNLEQANFGQPLKWASNASKAKNLKVEQINLKNLTLSIRDLQLGSFDGKVALTDTGALSTIELVSSNNALSVKVSPQGNASEVVLKATNWVLPFNQKIMFGVLNAKGLASQNQLNFSKIEGEIFGGNMTGQANIEWPNGAGNWLSSGKFKLVNANAQALLNNFGSAVVIDGQLALEANFSGKAREASKLANAIITNANFDVRQGRIQGLELARGVLSPGRQSLAGDNTNFEKLTGNININQNHYQFGKLVLTSPQFNANGYANINANQIVSGRVHADLVAQSRRLQASFGVTGRGRDLKSQ